MANDWNARSGDRPGRRAGLDWFSSQTEAMTGRVIELAAINSGTSNQQGVRQVGEIVTGWLKDLGADVQQVGLPPISQWDERGEPQSLTHADAIVGRCRRDAPYQVLLGIHLDTVYGLDHPFQQVQRRGDDILHGPGVADAKGGLVVMLTALEAFERFGGDGDVAKTDVGWTVFLNPDEETGSRASVDLLHDLAREADFGMVFEPSLPDGTLIANRKGSGNFEVAVQGRAAHAGREISRGRNAISALCRLLLELEQLAEPDEVVTVNLGRVRGGGPVNIVPDWAIGSFNVRVKDMAAWRRVETKMNELVQQADAAEGIAVQRQGELNSPPKPLDGATERLLRQIIQVGESIGLTLQSADSGGVCDGNKLAAAGLPNIDTLGPRGGQIHSDQEYLLIDSLAERAGLSFAVLDAFVRCPEDFPLRRNRHLADPRQAKGGA